MLCIARIDGGTSRTRRTKSNTSELQAGRSCPGASIDQIERKITHPGIFFFRQHLKTVDDRTNRADHIMADPAAQKCCKIEGVEVKQCHGVICLQETNQLFQGITPQKREQNRSGWFYR